MMLPTLFLSHGGGPWPFMKNQLGDAYRQLEESLQMIPRQLPSPPKAVLMVSAHWEEDEFTIMTHPKPPMLYDYYGFPNHTYHVTYDAKGVPTLAKQVQTLLEKAGISSHLNPSRGFDHGAFVPMAVMYPDAQIPMLQLSLKRGLNPLEHLKMGEAIASLRSEGILIIGSGLSYHNLRRFGPMAKEISRDFDQWLHETLQLSGDDRFKCLVDWENAPSARSAHPREDHLVPVFVSVGAAKDSIARRIYHENDFMGGVTASSYWFE